jgi:hypothetical protein
MKMADDTITPNDLEKMKASLPKAVQKAAKENKPATLAQLFPENENMARALAEKGFISDGKRQIGVIMDPSGKYVEAIAAKVSRTPDRSYDIISDLSDFSLTQTDNRDQKMQLYYKIYHNEGIINNAINKTAALVSSKGTFFVQRARQGKRKIANVEDELTAVLNYWVKNVNARAVDSAVTGSRGLPGVLSQATRMALIEGSWIGYSHEKNVDIPSLGTSYQLPMFLQTMSTRYIVIPDGLVGTGLELFYWKPPRQFINKLTNPGDKDLKKVYDDAFSPEVVSSLKKDGQVLLEKERVFHVKHRGLDIEDFGESFIEPSLADLAYKRTLQALDFVIVDSLINRIIIIKLGSDDPESAYHNLEYAQKRLALLQRMFDTVDPSMTILWAGPDIDVLDVGVHGKVAELDGRYDIAHERLILALGVPRPLLTGDAQGQSWAGYEGYKQTLKELQDSFAQTLVAIGERIATNNGFEGVELTFEFDASVLADAAAAADLALRVRAQGLSSIRKAVSDLGGDFESERRNRLLEMGEDPDADTGLTDDEIFAAPLGMPGDTRVDQDGNLKDPGRDPTQGRPPDSQREDLKPERDLEKKQPKKTTKT